MMKQELAETGQHLEDAPALSSEQERGIEQALASLKAGKGRSLDEVRLSIRATLTKRR